MATSQAVFGNTRPHNTRSQMNFHSPGATRRDERFLGKIDLPNALHPFLPSFCFSSRLRVMSPPQHFARTFVRGPLTVSGAMIFAPVTAAT
jgi:hypothetical protein